MVDNRCSACEDRIRDVEKNSVQFGVEFQAIRKDLDKISIVLERMADMSTDIKILKRDISEAVKLNESTISIIHKRIDEIEEDLTARIKSYKEDTDNRINKSDSWLIWTGRIIIGAVIFALLAKIGLNK